METSVIVIYYVDLNRTSRAQAVNKAIVIVMPPARQMRNCSVSGAAYMPNGCSSRVTSSAPINRCTPHGRQTRHFKHGGHQRDDRDIFGKVGMRPDRAAKLGTAAVAEARPVSLAQPYDL